MLCTLVLDTVLGERAYPTRALTKCRVRLPAVKSAHCGRRGRR